MTTQTLTAADVRSHLMQEPYLGAPKKNDWHGYDFPVGPKGSKMRVRVVPTDGEGFEWVAVRVFLMTANGVVHQHATVQGSLRIISAVASAMAEDAMDC